MLGKYRVSGFGYDEGEHTEKIKYFNRAKVHFRVRYGYFLSFSVKVLTEGSLLAGPYWESNSVHILYSTKNAEISNRMLQVGLTVDIKYSDMNTNINLHIRTPVHTCVHINVHKPHHTAHKTIQ